MPSDYAKLLDLVWSPPSHMEEEAPLRLPGELELQALWFDGLFGDEFTTTDFKPVRIVQFGEWNRAAGPDFLHCAAEIDGVRHAGPIELDTHPADWEAHGHATNPAFNKVILHVVFRTGGPESFARTADHRLVPRVVVPPERIVEALDLPRRETAVARAGRCAEPLANHSPESIRALLTEAARRRAEQKAARFLRTAAVQGRDAALFQALAETLGYRVNRLPMRLLAQRVPVASLRETPPESVLLGAAGFLDPEMIERAPANTRDHLTALWKDWWKLRARFGAGPERALPWALGGQRPANHPHRRVAALAVLAAHWAGFRRHAMARPFSPKAVIQYLRALSHPFWDHHYTLGSKPTARRLAMVGRDRALELLANHLVPLALHEDPEFSWDDYLRLPSPAPNTKIKRACLRLFGARDDLAALLRPLAHHQAILEIYHDFCLEDLSDCTECPFPEQLAMWDEPGKHNQSFK